MFLGSQSVYGFAVEKGSTGPIRTITLGQSSSAGTLRLRAGPALREGWARAQGRLRSTGEWMSTRLAATPFEFSGNPHPIQVTGERLAPVTDYLRAGEGLHTLSIENDNGAGHVLAIKGRDANRRAVRAGSYPWAISDGC